MASTITRTRYSRPGPNSEADAESRNNCASAWVCRIEAGQLVEIGPSMASRTAEALRSSGTQQMRFVIPTMVGQVSVKARPGTAEMAHYQCRFGCLSHKWRTS